MRRWRTIDPASLAGLFVVWAVAWSVRPGQISEDTKNDLYVDPWGFLQGALHLWDPQVTWGGLQNQAYGYLFPMGPFFSIGSEFLPVWVVQRLWWATLLTAGFVATIGLLRALGVGTPRVNIIAALAYVLAPRVLSTIGGLSSEAQPQLLAPAILWPLVLVERGRLGTRKGAALSALAILCCGGVNATATAFAILPSAIWLLTRSAWWRQSITWIWGFLVLAATSWWLVPLLVLGQHSPPFLDWIENSQTVTSQITMLDVLRGTTHWLGHLATAAGAWWPAGYQLVSSRTAIVLTTAVMVLGLTGLATKRLPHRAFLVVCLTTGVLVISLPHEGPFASPVNDLVQNALDGPLSPLRNVHKADLLVRLPLAVGLAHLLARIAVWRPRVEWQRGALLTASLLLVVGAASPGFGGAIAPRGTFVEMAPQWRDLGNWLEQQEDERALIVPASSFGEYVWGRTMDEPLRALTTAAYAVRDAVPLAPAGTIRLLDEVEQRLQTGRSLGGAASMLRAAGARHLVLRNDLNASDAGQPPVALARSALLNTPDISFTRGFGQSWLDATGERVFPIEVYSLGGPVAPELALWESDQVVGATGATEDLARLDEAGLDGRPVIFDGDRTEYLVPTREVVTDGFRARTRWFGAERGQDVSSGLQEQAARGAPDYLPWPEANRRSVIDYEGIRTVSASSSIADDYSIAGLQPAHRPYAALDGNPTTSWATIGDPAPELTIGLKEPTDLRQITVRPYADRVRFGQGLGVATDVTVTTDRGSVESRLTESGPTTIPLPLGSTSEISVRIRDTTAGEPSAVVTGLSEVALPGVEPTELVRTPQVENSTADTAVLGAGLTGRDGCSILLRQFTCFAGILVDPESTGPMVREVVGLTPGIRKLGGTMELNPLRPPAELTRVPGVTVAASSQRGYAAAGLPMGIVDSDKRTAWSPSPSDESPSVTLSLDKPTTFEGIRVQARRDWAAKAAPAVVIDVDGHEVTRRLPEHGVLTIPPTTGRRITLTFVSVPGQGRPGMGSLELEEVELIGHPFDPPADQFSGACGSGPRVTVDGRVVATSAKGTRAALFGLEEFTWEACEPVTLSNVPTHRIDLAPWRGLAPGTAVIAPFKEKPATAPGVVLHERVTPTLLRADVQPGAQKRVLVMAENANDGWHAHIGHTLLQRQVVDGRRQGFVIPAGLSGHVMIEFAPDRPYRWGLLVGGLLALGVVVLALWPDRGRRRSRLIHDGTITRSWLPMLLAVLVGCLLAGPVGVVVVAVATGVASSARLPPRACLCVVVGLGLSAALVQAWFAPGVVGSSAVEGTVRLLVLAAFVLALTRKNPPGEA
ncbi:alpha-(1-_3)-arabinofuranosyltransferase domain-containing protein [Knoellia sp. CPCC 206453]|uniref:alpha-(1->3)-arabinofuranosyltransferase domain-containing protein n=1 Tax=Knoellia pratensis TaxID=3404796 RepID=UPI0036178E17